MNVNVSLGLRNLLINVCMLIIYLVGICLGVEVKRENNKIIPYIV